MIDFNQLNERMSELQDKMKDIDSKIKAIKVTKEAGAGLVKITMNGTYHLSKIEIGEDLIVKKDKEMLEDLIVAAVNLAVNEVDLHVKNVREESSIDMLGKLQ